MQCQLDYIKELKQDSARRDALKSLPSGLSETYEFMLERLIPSDLKIARAALTWVIYSLRPLLLKDLALVSVIDPETDFDEENCLDYDEMILEICGSFFKVNTATQVVEVGHFSIQEYITAQTLHDGRANKYYISAEEGHTLIMKQCLSYLRSQQVFSDGASDTEIKYWRRVTFLRYAVRCWPTHAQKVSGHLRWSSVVCFFKSDSYHAWSAAYTTFEAGDALRSWSDKLRSMLPVPPLYFAAAFGFQEVVTTLIENGADPNEGGGVLGYPIFAAVNNGNLAVTEMLLVKGANPQVSRDDQKTPLHIAAYDWSKELVELLVEKGADVRSKDAQGLTPLLWTMIEPHYKIGRQSRRPPGKDPHPQVIECLSSGNRLSGDTAVAFYTALRHSRFDSAKQLWHMCSSDDNIPEMPALLHKAVKEGRIGVSSASSDAAFDNIYFAIRTENLRAVILCLTNGASVDAKDKDLRTPLHHAAQVRSPALVCLLLLAGAEIDARDADGNTPLHHALGFNLI